MDKINTFKAMLPFIPSRYRRPLLLFIHIEELICIINSLKECMNMQINTDECKPADASKLFEMLKERTSDNNSDMMSMLMPILFSGGFSAEALSGLTSAFSSLNADNTAHCDEHCSKQANDDIDSLFKDFIDETRNENNYE